MNVPDGGGRSSPGAQPWYIDPDTYFPGQGMPREHDYLARHGMSCCTRTIEVMHPRDSDKNVITNSVAIRELWHINAVKAVKSSAEVLDKDGVGCWDLLGGGVTLTALVAQPGLVDARAVIYASVSSLAADNWKQFSRRSDDRSDQPAYSYGLPDKSPGSGARPRRGPLRSGNRAAAGAPRHSRRHLSDPLVRIDSQGPQSGGRKRHFRQVPRGRPYIRAPVAALD